MSSLSEQSEKGRIEDAVERAIWEPMHEWESRVKFVKDNVERHGLDKAVQLSIVWGNMKFLGCRYPAKTEALVSYYPLPTPDELREIRIRRPHKRPLIEDTTGPSDQKKPIPSRQEVSNLISSIRSQTEQVPLVKVSLVESIAKSLCLCERCVGRRDNMMAMAHKVLEQHKALCNQSVDITFREAAGGQTCVLVYRGDVAIEKTAGTQKDAESAVCMELMRRVEEWQEANQFPACKFSAPPTHSASPSSNYPPPSHYSPSHFTPPPSHPSHRQPPSQPPSGSYNSPPNTYQQPRYPPPQEYHTPQYDTYRPPPSSYQSPDYSQRGQGGNYFMPPRAQGAGNPSYRGGYNQDNYYRR